MAKTLKEPVRIRFKKIKDGNQSIYLDIYVNGVRSYEFLKLYLVPERTKAEKERNKETLALAASIKAKRVLEIQSGIYGLQRKIDSVRFFDFIDQMIERKKETQEENTLKGWLTFKSCICTYEDNDKITFKQIDEKWVLGFKNFLDNHVAKGGAKLKNNTKWGYITKLKACFNEAIKRGVIERNPARNVKNYSLKESERQFLTLEELQLLAKTKCEREDIARMFLFSCLTGLRWSDVTALKWGDVTRFGDTTRITYTQKKTKALEYLDLNAQAVELMGEWGDEQELVFPIFMAHKTALCQIAKWVKSAGINKHITYHCARHTFAVLMLDLGTDIYTTSKLLGHKRLETTQVYAKVLDKNKQEAVNKIPKIM